jgi:flagellar biogenesis protein FliO
MEWAASAGVLIVLGLAAAVFWLAARRPGGLAFGRGREKGPAEIVQRLPLTAQHSLHVIRVQDETLLVVTYPSGAVVSRGRTFPEWMAEWNIREREASR